MGKHHQKHVWGTRDWFRSYARRGAVERTFSNLKATKGKLRSGWTLQVGLVKLSLLTAITFMAHNLETLLRWTKLHGAGDSYIASLTVRNHLEHDPDPGIDLESLPEHLQPA